MKDDEMSLSGLTEFKFDPEEIRQVFRENDISRAEYKAKYGEDWLVRWLVDKGLMPDYDSELKDMNVAIYGGYMLHYHGTVPHPNLRERFEARKREVYGDRYDELSEHEWEDPRVGELLILDAIKTGKWKELPDGLQAEYHRCVDGRKV